MFQIVILNAYSSYKKNRMGYGIVINKYLGYTTQSRFKLSRVCAIKSRMADRILIYFFL